MGWINDKLKEIKGWGTINLTLITPPANDCLTPHIGLLQLASCLLKVCNVSIVDLNFFLKDNPEVTPEQVLAEVEATNPDVLGISTRCDNYPLVISFARIYKEKNKKTKIVLGGPQASLTAKETLEAFPFVDAIVVGEGEETLKELIHAYKEKKNLKGITGLAYREGDQVIVNAPRQLIANLDELPLPAYHLAYPLKDYSRLGETVTTAYIITSRGCPFQCSYCSTPKLWEKKIRYRSLKNVMNEIRMLQETQGVVFIALSDDIFGVDKKRLKEFCAEMKKIEMEWSCSARIDTLNKELLKEMADSGCKSIFYGIESGSKKILEAMNKGAKFTPQLAKDVVKETISQGIQVTASFIVGFPEEGKEDLEDTKKLAEELTEFGAETQGHILGLLPQTEVYEKNKTNLERGRVLSNITYLALPKSIGEYFCKDTNDLIWNYPQIFSSYYAIKTKLTQELIRDYSLYITSLQAKLQKKEINLGFGL